MNSVDHIHTKNYSLRYSIILLSISISLLEEKSFNVHVSKHYSFVFVTIKEFILTVFCAFAVGVGFLVCGGVILFPCIACYGEAVFVSLLYS